MSKQLQSNLLNMIQTYHDAQVFLKELDLLERAYYATDKERMDTILLEEIRFEFSEVIRDYLKTSGMIQESFFQEMRSKLRRLKPLRLTLGFRPSQGFIDRLSAWVKTNVGEHVVVQLHVDRKLIGGVQLEYNGKYGDYSLGRKVHDLFEYSKKQTVGSR